MTPTPPLAGMRPKAIHEMATLIAHALGAPALLKLLSTVDTFELPVRRTLVHLHGEVQLREQLGDVFNNMPAGTKINGIVGSRLPTEHGRLLGTMLIPCLGPVVMLGEGRDIDSQIASIALHPCPIDGDAAMRLARSALDGSTAGPPGTVTPGDLEAMSDTLTALSRLAAVEAGLASKVPSIRFGTGNLFPKLESTSHADRDA
ncbi:hypothetical protein [Cupriavidus oxalaticus]|uniref:Uncharacterized protein n=1 Tax=Cupriavidus oxalaticus TaxID=96344 RepID=A0A4P7LJE9_9BURK|nr:hypothetical protein [Cupriavidus oxalaticus]QBY56266.1 hypothetical protein E0W60_35085 [Cupriavidus oxalaticus]